MHKMFLLHTHLLVCQRNSLLQHCPSNFLFATCSAIFHISANMSDMHVQCIGTLYHCDAITSLWDVGEPELVQVHVLPAFHHNYLTSTIPPPSLNIDRE